MSDPGAFSGVDWASNTVNVIKNIADNVEPIQRLITAAAYILGLLFGFKALYTLKIYGEARTMMSSNATAKEPLTYLFVSAVLLMSPKAVEVLLATTFGSSSILQYGPITSSNQPIEEIFGSGSEVAKPLMMIIQTVGYVAFVRGWILIARASAHGQQPGGSGKGLMHVFGGILAINIVSTLQIVNNTIFGS
ncbi:MAG: type IV secretion protein IcmC [Gammaproteobacteria bacterium RIFCSPHIGHO2_12_FULL_41_15]|nr:MAG: type IV secretion protein IcmC [Gammaproteobacteria bacterium RIFCSPHIGHO2_12_FULL_41_15]